MSDLSITVSGTKRLLTQGKFCDKNIVVTAESSNDAFWDIYQQNGNRTDYNFAFAGNGWNDETFKPKYDIIPTDTGSMFQKCYISDLVKILNDCGVVFDMSQAAESVYLVNACNNLTTLPVLDCRGRANIGYFIIDSPKLHTIEKVILKEDGSQTFNTYSFLNLSGLEEIRFEGCIGSSLAINNSTRLSAESVQSIIDCLKDLTGEAAQTLTLHANVGENMTEAQKATITAKNWTLVY